MAKTASIQHKDRLSDEERKARRHESARKYRDANREKCVAASLASRAKKPDYYTEKNCEYKQDPAYIERQRQYRQTNKDRLQEKTRQWQKTSPKWAAYTKRYQREKSAAAILRSKQWRSDNPERSKELSAKWRKEKPHLNRLKQHRRRAQKLQVGGQISPGIYQSLMLIQRSRCACCKADLRMVGRHLDHIIPLALGGPNSDDNAQLLCPPCNLSKGAKHPVDFMQQRGYLL